MLVRRRFQSKQSAALFTVTAWGPGDPLDYVASTRGRQLQRLRYRNMLHLIHGPLQRLDGKDRFPAKPVTFKS